MLLLLLQLRHIYMCVYGTLVDEEADEADTERTGSLLLDSKSLLLFLCNRQGAVHLLLLAPDPKGRAGGGSRCCSEGAWLYCCTQACAVQWLGCRRACGWGAKSE